MSNLFELNIDDSNYCKFESDGRLTAIVSKDSEIALDGIRADLGVDGKYINGLLEWSSFENFHTWDLPPIVPIPKQNNLYTPKAFVYTEESFIKVSETTDEISITLTFSAKCGALCISAEIENLSKITRELNGFAFILNLSAQSGVVFDFPGNVPCFVCNADEIPINQVVSSGLVNSATHLNIAGTQLNAIFIDTIEKWACGAYRTGDGFNLAYVPGLEINLAPAEKATVGDLFLQPVAKNENPYLAIRDFYEALGYEKAEGGITDGVMYSCHPAGTMDTNFPLKNDLFLYAEYLPKLREMGIDHVWLLPIFDHEDRGVYHSTDQAIIDQRYGGDDAVRFYINKAHELGMTVLFDYVPHGPTPDDPLGKRTLDWCSRRKDGSLQIEWDCVSYDYNNPEYINYTTELVCDHVKRFDVDGARIDCAMGGLSNWAPLPGERPSGNSVRAGVNITKATRDGFLKGKKRSFILPENFNPLPQYFPYTDIYYGMTLYRVFCELEEFLKNEPERYVSHLINWLERENQTLPRGYCKLRFLGNHDTVSWVWQASRAVPLYGEGAAKSLFAMISLIDGMPMIYQGDEDPVWYGADTIVLFDFFKKLFSDRKQLNGDIQYLKTNTPVMAFLRGDDTAGQKLVLINFSPETQFFNAAEHLESRHILNCSDTVQIKGFAYSIFNLEGGEI